MSILTETMFRRLLARLLEVLWFSMSAADMNDVEANEAVINKNWFRQVADAEAPSLQSEMGVTTRPRVPIHSYPLAQNQYMQVEMLES